MSSGGQGNFLLDLAQGLFARLRCILIETIAESVLYAEFCRETRKMILMNPLQEVIAMTTFFRVLFLP